MTRDEFRTMMARLYAIEPAYKQWVRDQAESLAVTLQTNVTGAYENLVSEWIKAVEVYSVTEVSRVLDDVAKTYKQLPTYSKLWRTLGGYASDNRQAERDSARAAREHQPRYDCLLCLDSGHVSVYNFRFVEWLRSRFLQWRDSGAFPTNWYAAARGEWNRMVIARQQKAPAELGLVCNCNCDSAVIYRRQVAAMVESNGVKRAAYIGQYEPRRDCLAASTPDDDLAKWYDTAPDPTAWEPEPGEYDRRFAS